jgi:hypothetical protein
VKPTIRCSELDRVLACNGSLTLVPLVAAREGDEGDAGTNIHENIAWMAALRLGATTEVKMEKSRLKPMGFDTWIADYCFRELKENVPDDWSLEVESAFAYEWDRFNLSGHIDALAMSPDETEAFGWDWKTGYDPVDPAEFNDQVLGYIILLKRAYPKLRKVTFKVVQPRNDEDEGFQRISIVTVTWEGVDFISKNFENRMNKALDNAMEVDSGKKQCRWCPVNIQCPAAQLEQDVMKVTLTPESIAKVKMTPDDAVLGDWVIAARTLEPMNKVALATLHKRLDTQPSVVAGNGTTISRTEENGSYSWPDPLKAFTAVRELLPKDESLAKVLTPSVTRIKEELATVMSIPKTGKAPVTAEGVFDAKLRPLCEQGKRKILVFQ